jgi:ectoine hydroxylase-related dioxygenase (phytanoyl-CoA dioxygenase family)
VALHLLEADFDVESADIVPCPLPKGGVTFHSQRTLHYTAANRTDRPRLAFPTEFQVAPRRRPTPAVRPWVDDWRAVSGDPDHLDQFPADGVLATIAG